MPDAINRAANGKTEPPWTAEQVAALNAFQSSGRFHPFTCPGDYRSCAGRRDLIARSDGWICQCGKYQQHWAHEAMLAAAVTRAAEGSGE